MAAENPWLSHAVVVGVYLSVAIVLLATSSPPPSSTPAGPALALMLVGSVVLVLRTRLPVTMLAAACVLLLASAWWGTVAELVLPTVLVFTVGARRRPAVAWVALVGTIVVATAAGALALLRAQQARPLFEAAQPPLTDQFWVDLLNAAILFTAPILVAALLGTNAGQRRRHVAALVDRAHQLARERDQRAELARAAERERIAREMHDVIAHSLTVMVALSEGAAATAPTDPEQAREVMTRAAETGRRTLAEVRRLLGSVRGESPETPAPLPGAAELPALAAEFAAAGLPVDLVTAGEPTTDAALGLAVYRIVQEALTNTLRHGVGATAAEVRVDWAANGQVSVEVVDDGSPAADTAPGRGLLGMRERAALFGGTASAGPGPGGGWRVAVTLGGRA